MGESQRIDGSGSVSNLIAVDYLDLTDGIHKRVLLPPGSTNYEEGIPVGLPLDVLYADAPVLFRKRLSDELYAHGLVEPRDFVQPGAPEKVRSALLAAIWHDTQDIVGLARKVLKNDSQ